MDRACGLHRDIGFDFRAGGRPRSVGGVWGIWYRCERVRDMGRFGSDFGRMKGGVPHVASPRQGRCTPVGPLGRRGYDRRDRKGRQSILADNIDEGAKQSQDVSWRCELLRLLPADAHGFGRFRDS